MRQFWYGFFTCASLVLWIGAAVWLQDGVYVPRLNEGQAWQAHRDQKDSIMFVIGHKPDMRGLWQLRSGHGMVIVDCKEPGRAEKIQNRIKALLDEPGVGR